MAAAKTAEAGNALEEADAQVETPDNQEKRSADFLAEEARRLTAINKLIEEMRDPEYKFAHTELKPLIVKTTQ